MHRSSSTSNISNCCHTLESSTSSGVLRKNIAISSLRTAPPNELNDSKNEPIDSSCRVAQSGWGREVPVAIFNDLTKAVLDLTDKVNSLHNQQNELAAGLCPRQNAPAKQTQAPTWSKQLRTTIEDRVGNLEQTQKNISELQNKQLLYQLCTNEGQDQQFNIIRAIQDLIKEHDKKVDLIYETHQKMFKKNEGECAMLDPAAHMNEERKASYQTTKEGIDKLNKVTEDFYSYAKDLEFTKVVLNKVQNIWGDEFVKYLINNKCLEYSLDYIEEYIQNWHRAEYKQGQVKEIATPQAKIIKNGPACYYFKIRNDVFYDLMYNAFTDDNQYVRELSHLIKDSNPECTPIKKQKKVIDGTEVTFWEMEDNGEIRTFYSDPRTTLNSIGIKETEFIKTILLAYKTRSPCRKPDKRNAEQTSAQLNTLVSEMEHESHKRKEDGKFSEAYEVQTKGINKMGKAIKEYHKKGDMECDRRKEVENKINNMELTELRKEFKKLLNTLVDTASISKKEHDDFMQLIKNPLNQEEEKSLQNYHKNKRCNINQEVIDKIIINYMKSDPCRYSLRYKDTYCGELEAIFVSRKSSNKINKKVSAVLRKMYDTSKIHWLQEKREFLDSLSQQYFNVVEKEALPVIFSLVHWQEQAEPIQRAKIESKERYKYAPQSEPKPCDNSEGVWAEDKKIDQSMYENVILYQDELHEHVKEIFGPKRDNLNTKDNKSNTAEPLVN